MLQTVRLLRCKAELLRGRGRAAGDRSFFDRSARALAPCMPSPSPIWCFVLPLLRRAHRRPQFVLSLALRAPILPERDSLAGGRELSCLAAPMHRAIRAVAEQPPQCGRWCTTLLPPTGLTGRPGCWAAPACVRLPDSCRPAPRRLRLHAVVHDPARRSSPGGHPCTGRLLDCRRLAPGHGAPQPVVLDFPRRRRASPGGHAAGQRPRTGQFVRLLDSCNTAPGHAEPHPVVHDLAPPVAGGPLASGTPTLLPRDSELAGFLATLSVWRPDRQEPGRGGGGQARRSRWMMRQPPPSRQSSARQNARCTGACRGARHAGR